MKLLSRFSGGGDEIKCLSTQDAVERWLLYCTRYSPHTQANYKTTITAFLKSAPANITDISVEHIENFIIKQRKNKKHSSINILIIGIRSFFNWLERTQGCKNIARSIERLRESPPDQRVISSQEYEIVCAADIKQTNLAMFKFLCHTGLRVSEYLSLRPENITNKMLHVVGKGLKSRYVPLNGTVLEIIERGGFVKKKTTSTIWRRCKEMSIQANIPVFGPHACRHYFATQLIMAGVALPVVSRLLGHASIKTTIDTYFHVLNDDLAGITDVLDGGVK